ncbi:Aste57867_10245 [Aphanomyces stellatus]|uniref:Aste57867_10245 protein n=1 Tax=Aphanomyces stellatus TaxID=120398 RepID=A0A485KPU8_9STRA|nr:hypothetical protein As57867_010206 [Aphanomyces stellatus]VFT87120.1 Aste57867_10245 [Aphanomyces stellatus]
MDSDSDDDVFNMNAVSLANAVDDDTLSIPEILQAAELAVIETDAAQIERLQLETSDAAALDTLELAHLVSQGQYADALRSAAVQSLFTKLQDAVPHHRSSSSHPCTWITNALEDIFLAHPSHATSLAYTVLYAGAAFLNLFVQLNYTGPAMEDAALADLLPLLCVLLDEGDAADKATLHRHAIVSLQVDGETPFSICEFPVFLEMGRVLLHFTGLQSRVNWSHSEAVDRVSKVVPLAAYIRQPRERNGAAQPLAPAVTQATRGLVTAAWWAGRALMTHQRLLLTKEPANTLWTETQFCFSFVVGATYPTDALTARAQLEWGLAQHFFDIKGKGRASFDDAMTTSGLRILMTGAMGKRTKYQVKSVAQMVLHAASKVENTVHASASAVAAADATHEDFGGRRGDKPVDVDGDGNPLSLEDQLVADGDATYRNITRDQADVDNILLEQVAFEETIVNTNLQVIDQAILLSFCLDVKNNNPADGLTTEQMMPYLTRVLDNPNNWMVYSTGLLERAWLECEMQRSRERAILQMQALVDQHTTRLTITQTSLKAIEDAAPASERMAFVYTLVFPPRYALKRDLAERYLSCGVYSSALEIFEELEMWDEVVQCHQLLDQPKRAEKLVRARLEVAPTPLMWCCLADLTDDVALYEKAWEASHHRFARAKRSWARKMYEQGRLAEAIGHLQQATTVAPMHTQAWFFLGSLAMRQEMWAVAFQAFTRVVQLAPDDGEAWGNLGSIHLRLGRHAEAFAAFQEALKQKRTLWQMWENFLLCAMEIAKYGDAMYAMHQLLDMRDKHERPVDHEMLAWLVQDIVYGKADKTDAGDDDEDAPSMAVVYPIDDDDDDIPIVTRAPPVSESNYKKQLAQLLGRVTSITTNNPKVWQVYAHYHDGCGNASKALECRLKECRALQKASWEHDQAAVELLCRAATRLAQNYMDEGSKASVHACRLYLRGIHKKAQVDFPTNDDVLAIEALLAQLETLEAQAK